MTSMDDSYDLNMPRRCFARTAPTFDSSWKALCEELSDTLGDRLRVQRGGSRFKKSEAISSVQITMASDQFEAVIDGSDLRCTVGHFSGGIRIRTKTLTSTYGSSNFSGTPGRAAHSDTGSTGPRKTLS